MINSYKLTILLNAAIFCGFHSAYADSSIRIWTDQQGRQVEARLVSFDTESGKVVLSRADGRELSLLKNQLHITDQEHLSTITTPGKPIEDNFGEPTGAEPLVARSNKTGPFGLWMGMSLEEIGVKAEQLKRPGWYKLESVPTPHHAFETYIVQVGPKNGLSWIKAVGRNISTSSFGSELQVAFEDMRQKLERQYGAHKKSDFLQRGSIWNEGRDWMMSVVKNERVLSAKWEGGPRSRLPNSLKSIYLGISALNSNSGYLVIEYSFLNEDAVEQELAAISDGAL